jgi:Adenylate and Guanylate cyclase catalytic domain
VRDRLFDQDKFNEKMANTTTQGPNKTLGTILVRSSKPIADLFTSATVLFADFVGFTSWCSVREPSQVFILLETVYDAFDTIAKRRGVFKVETIGDCYVAACGLPVPRDDHAVVMARFSAECLQQLVGILQSLEVLLGPGTVDLGKATNRWHFGLVVQISLTLLALPSNCCHVRNAIWSAFGSSNG